jgi:hypothetical protein
VVAAGDDGQTRFYAGEVREPEAVPERLVSLLRAAESGDGGGNAPGIDGVANRVRRINKGRDWACLEKLDSKKG